MSFIFREFIFFIFYFLENFRPSETHFIALRFHTLPYLEVYQGTCMDLSVAWRARQRESGNVKQHLIVCFVTKLNWCHALSKQEAVSEKKYSTQHMQSRTVTPFLASISCRGICKLAEQYWNLSTFPAPKMWNCLPNAELTFALLLCSDLWLNYTS